MLLNCGVVKTLESPVDSRRSNQSILKEISPGCSLEGLMLKLKLQYFGHLMGRVERKKVKMKLLSRVQLFGIPWTVVYQASLSMGFSRQEYWNGLPFPSPGDLPHPGIETGFPTL